MIEDSLKTARTIHRLILGVGVAALIFAFSLEKPVRESAWLEHLRAWERLPFDDYREYAVDLAATSPTWGGHAAAVELLENASNEALVFGVERIHEALGKPLHVGRVLVEDLVFTDADAAKLSSIESVLRLDGLDRRVQVLVPRDSVFVDDIAQFLRDMTSAGANIESLDISFGDVSFLTDTFVTAEEAMLSIYFEARSAGGMAPVFTGVIPCEVRELDPESSFRAWLFRQDGVDEVIAEQHGDLQLFPSLRPFPEGWSERTLGELRLAMDESIRSASPEARTISIVTFEVPGSLVLLAVPLSLVGLLLYLRAHVRHLALFVSPDAEDDDARTALRRFGWLPLRGDRDGILDRWITIRLLPPVSCAVLLWRVWRFEMPSAWAISTMLAGIATTSWIGHRLAGDLAELRRRRAGVTAPADKAS